MLAKLTARLQARRAAADDAPSESDLRREVKYFSDIISRKLEQLNICYRYRKNERDLIEKGVQRVRFDMAIAQRDAIYLRLDTRPRKFPRGITLAHINDDVILDDLSVACARPVHYRRAHDGAWLIIERQVGTFGIRRISFNEVEARYPTKSLKELNVPLGLTYNRRIVYRSLAEFPHVLIGGATGAGKTTFMHVWICALIRHHSANDVRMALVDLKGGTEFTRYKGLPHLLDDYGFVKDEEDVIPLLENLETEMRRRLALFERHGGIQNLAQWNVRALTSPRYEHLPRMVLFVDELSAIMLRPALRKKAIPLLTTLGERGRAPGIHIVLATQRPVVRVVDGQIKGNLEARIAFRVTDNTSSMVILDSVDAAQMPEASPPGRYIYKRGLDRMELQAPLITPYQIKEIVRAVITGDEAGAAEASSIAPEDVFRVALTIGTFALAPLYKAMQGRASKRFLENLARDYEGEVIELDGITYKLCAPAGDFQPRRLVPTAELERAAAMGGDDADLQRDGDGGIGDIAQPIAQTALAIAQTEPPIAQTEPSFSIENALSYAVAELDGVLSSRKLYQAFKGRVLYNDLIALLSEYDDASVEVDGTLYYCEPGAGRRPRRLIEISS